MKLKNLTSYSFVYLMCVIISIPPLVYLTTLFWTKGIDTQMHIMHPDRFDLPSFTICSDFKNFIDYQKVTSNKTLFNNMNKFFNEKNVTNQMWIKSVKNSPALKFFGTQMNLSDLPAYIRNVNQILESISLYGVVNLPEEDKKLSSEQIGKKYCRKDVVIKNSFLCIVITCQLNNQRLIISDKAISRSHVQRGVMGRFKFVHNEIKDFTYILIGAHQEQLLIGYEDRLSEIKIREKPHLYQFQVRTYTNILLPAPSKTNCKNYTIDDDGSQYQNYALSRCLFDRLVKRNMVFFPNSINISWIAENSNRSIFLNKRPQYNGLDLDDEGIESKDAARIFDKCSKKFKQPNCIEVIYMIYYLIPIDLDSTTFYDDGTFRYDKEFKHLLEDIPETEINETELIMHDNRKYLYSVFQLLQSSYPLMTNKHVDGMELKEYILLMASVYGTFTTFRVSQLIRRLLLYIYSTFLM